MKIWFDFFDSENLILLKFAKELFTHSKNVKL